MQYACRNMEKELAGRLNWKFIKCRDAEFALSHICAQDFVILEVEQGFEMMLRFQISHSTFADPFR